MKHIMKLNPQPFDMIKSGKKTIELRLYDEKRKAIAKGDTIKFIRADTKSELICLVENLYVFESFKALYEGLSLLKCGYSEANIDRASFNDMNEYYSLEKQEQYGVVGIEVKLL